MFLVPFFVVQHPENCLGDVRYEALMGKMIGLTYDLKTDYPVNTDDPVDINAEYDSMETVNKVAQALENGGHKVKKIGNIHKLLSSVDHLGVDIVFNICEGKGGRNRESQVPMLLELKGIPCVGTDALAQGISLDKIVTKKMFIADSVPTPKFFAAWHTDDLKKLNTIGFPLIVKTCYEGTSKGLTDSSRVENLEELRKQVEIINKKYHQVALVEEFIRGTEFTVPVIGNDPPLVMPVAQICIDGKVDLGDDFFTFARVTDVSLRYICPAKISNKLTKQLQELSIKAYKSIGCRDLGRVDFRVDDKGNIYVLEINPLPSLAANDVFNIFPEVFGTTYNEIINRILDHALKRYGMLDKKNLKNNFTEKQFSLK